MAKSGAVRQAEYRASKADERRINVWINQESALALDRLTRHTGGTQSAVIEKLLLEENRRVTDTLKTNEAWRKYHD